MEVVCGPRLGGTPRLRLGEACCLHVMGSPRFFGVTKAELQRGRKWYQGVLGAPECVLLEGIFFYC